MLLRFIFFTLIVVKCMHKHQNQIKVELKERKKKGEENRFVNDRVGIGNARNFKEGGGEINNLRARCRFVGVKTLHHLN